MDDFRRGVRSAEHRVELGGGPLLHRRQDVTVGVEGDPDARVP